MVPIHRVAAAPTLEGGQHIHKVATPPQVTTSTNPMTKRDLLSFPRTDMHQTWNNDPNMLPPIETEAPAQRRSNRLNHELQEARLPATPSNWLQVPFASPNMISQEAVNLVKKNI